MKKIVQSEVNGSEALNCLKALTAIVTAACQAISRVRHLLKNTKTGITIPWRILMYDNFSLTCNNVCETSVKNLLMKLIGLYQNGI